MTLPVLRRLIDEATLRGLWRGAVTMEFLGDRSCPACRRAMVEVEVAGTDGPVAVDACRPCQLVWFDAAEMEHLPRRAVPAELDPEPWRSARRAPERAPSAREEIGGWRMLPALLGMPVEVRAEALRSRPIATWSLAIVVTIVSVLAFADEELLTQFAFVPDRALRLGGITALTAFFLHGGWLHLIGNMYFLVAFGDNVEDYLGRRRWALLVLAATLVGSLLHWLGEPASRLPCVGASGGISGLIAFYALRFPHARLGSVFWFFLYPRWITYPAWGGFVFWMLTQGVLAWQQLAGIGSVSALAHLGGALVGFIAWLRWRSL